MFDSLDFVAAGIAQWLHDGCVIQILLSSHRRGAGPGHSGTKGFVAVSTVAGEGEILERRWSAGPERFCRSYDTFSRKVLQSTFHHKITERSNRYGKEKYVYRGFCTSYADRQLGGLCNRHPNSQVQVNTLTIRSSRPR